MKARRVDPIINSPANTKTELVKRPNHPDYMTSAELEKKQWSGIRKNQMALNWEFWILGKVEKYVSFQTVADDPNALRDAHVELFQMSPEAGTFRR